MLGEASLSAMLGGGLNLTSIWPFVGLLMSLVVGPFWSRWPKIYPLVVLGFLGGGLWVMNTAWGFSYSTYQITHTFIHEMIPFGLTITTLYVLTSCMGMKLSYSATPGNNTIFLAVTSLSASLLGTTGAAMLTLPSLLSVLRQRYISVHTVIFFIFLVCNIGGSLTPLGDPPLLLGFLYGIPFSWPFIHLIFPFLILWIGCLAVYWLTDSWAYSREGKPPLSSPVTISLHGYRYAALFCLALVVLAASSMISLGCMTWGGLDWPLSSFMRDFTLASIVVYSARHHTEKLNWHPIQEIMIVFSGLFITAIPVLSLLGDVAGPFSDLRHWMMPDNQPIPLRFFCVAGLLSAFLDNAPTYMTFFHLVGKNPSQMITEHATTLQALSCGAVFMGALTYIGNAPNMMVRSLATEAGVSMPSFLGYWVWSFGILGPLLVLTGWLFWAL